MTGQRYRVSKSDSAKVYLSKQSKETWQVFVSIATIADFNRQKTTQSQTAIPAFPRQSLAAIGENESRHEKN